MSAFQVLGFIVAMGLLKGCGLLGDGQSQSRIQGVTLPFYQTSTYRVPVEASMNKSMDSLENVLYEVHLRVLRKLMRGGLTGYQNETLERKFDLAKIRSRARLEGYNQSPGSLADKAFRENFIQNIDRQRFHAYAITLSWQWQAEKQTGRLVIKSLTPYFRPSAGGTSLGEQPLASVKYIAVLESLKKDLRARFRQSMKQHLFNQLQQSGVNDLPLAYKAGIARNPSDLVKRPLVFRTDSGFKGILGRQFGHVQEKLLKTARSGALTVFKSDSLKQTYPSGKAVKRIRADKAVVKVLKGSGDQQYFGDTTIYNQLSASQFKRYWLLERWKPLKQAGHFQLKPLALAPVYRPERGGVTLSGTSLFWVRLKDVKPVLKPTENRWLRAYLFYTLQRQLTGVSFNI